MQRVFFWRQNLNCFAGVKKSNVDRRQLLLVNQRGLMIERLVFEHLFFTRRTGQTAIRKIVAKFPGGGCMTASKVAT
jgi:hypothetical protein